MSQPLSKKPEIVAGRSVAAAKTQLTQMRPVHSMWPACKEIFDSRVCDRPEIGSWNSSQHNAEGFGANICIPSSI